MTIKLTGTINIPLEQHETLIQKRGAASPWGEQSKDLKRDFEKSGDWSLFEEDD